eukprot:231537-Rhodomonas_salina.1
MPENTGPTCTHPASPRLRQPLAPTFAGRPRRERRDEQDALRLRASEHEEREREGEMTFTGMQTGTEGESAGGRLHVHAQTPHLFERGDSGRGLLEETNGLGRLAEDEREVRGPDRGEVRGVGRERQPKQRRGDGVHVVRRPGHRLPRDRKEGRDYLEVRLGPRQIWERVAEVEGEAERCARGD